MVVSAPPPYSAWSHPSNGILLVFQGFASFNASSSSSLAILPGKPSPTLFLCRLARMKEGRLRGICALSSHDIPLGKYFCGTKQSPPPAPVSVIARHCIDSARLVTARSGSSPDVPPDPVARSRGARWPGHNKRGGKPPVPDHHFESSGPLTTRMRCLGSNPRRTTDTMME